MESDALRWIEQQKVCVDPCRIKARQPNLMPLLMPGERMRCHCPTATVPPAQAGEDARRGREELDVGLLHMTAGQ
jgi:hypothetical protein